MASRLADKRSKADREQLCGFIERLIVVWAPTRQRLGAIAQPILLILLAYQTTARSNVRKRFDWR